MKPAQRATQTETPTVAGTTEDRSVNAKSRPPRRRSILRGALIAFLLALSGIVGLQGYLGSTTGNLPRPQLATASADLPALKTTPIEQIRVGQRVLTKGEDPDKTLPTAVDQQTWRHLTLEQTETWPDGTVDRICIESILPPQWLAQHDGAPVGTRVPIPLDLEEMGLPEGMTAQVLANEPCPAISTGPGRVVLTTVNHLNTRVVEMTLAAPDGTQETVRPTAFHKFYSETRGQWLSAEDLKPDERLRGLHTPLQVVSLAPVPGTHRVYNMTVEGEHVYHVSTLGVLAHNNNCGDDLVDLALPARRRHILDGEVRPNGTHGGGHRGGTGFPGKSEFPTHWSDDEIMHHISDVATDPASVVRPGHGSDIFVQGTRDGIDIEVLIRNGEIWTGYPINVPRNPF